LDHEIQKKMEAKFDSGKANAALSWISNLTGKGNDGDVTSSLKSGVLLCEAINKIWPGTVKKISNSSMPFSQRENIVAYLDGCKSHGLKETDLFVTTNLYEGSNVIAVIDNIFALGILAQQSKAFKGPYLTVSGGGVGQTNQANISSYNNPAPKYTPTSVPSSKPVNVSDDGGARFCPGCGAKRDGDSKFCAECGGKY